MENIPNWIKELNNEEFSFLKNFVLNSGSLKELAKLYGVSYPTIRLRLDRLIQKISMIKEQSDPFVSLVKELALDDRLDYTTAKVIIEAYKKNKEV